MITEQPIDSVVTSISDDQTKSLLKRYEKAQSVRKNWIDLFEECYEYALPQRESFYQETAGQRRDDKIFDETAVVGVQAVSYTHLTLPTICSV